MIFTHITPTDWMQADDTRRLFAALGADGAAVRFVGGCVRDALLEREVSDLDVATDAVPETVMALLERAGIHVVATGLDHGTVTAIPDHRPFQITTLRRDVETDGRHAVVSYTKYWSEDAERRDFTINAMSANLDGTVFDYQDGIIDLDEGRIRFIGTAADRIAEDYLRVLRFFRFQATYGKTDPDPVAVEACAAAADHIPELSGERLWQEFSRILGASDPADILTLMAHTGVLAQLLPVKPALDDVSALHRLEETLGRAPDRILRLAAVAPAGGDVMAGMADRFRLSRADARRLRGLGAERGAVAPGMPQAAFRRMAYAEGAQRMQDLVLMDWAAAMSAGTVDETDAAWAALWAAARDWTAPDFPVSGADVMALGVSEGPEVGTLIAETKNWWVDENFTPDREACLARMRAALARRADD